MSVYFKKSEEGINLTCTSQEYSPKTVGNLGLTNLVCTHPVMLSVKERNTVLFLLLGL